MLKIVLIFFYCINILALQSCSFFRSKPPRDFFPIGTDFNSSDNYRYLLSERGTDLLKTYESQIINPDQITQIYLKNISKKIVVNNELIFKRTDAEKLNFIIFKSSHPFYFSYPPGNIVISTELINRYIDHEGFLLSLISGELLRLEHSIYVKQKNIPVGFISLEKFISMLRIPIQERMKLHRWSYYLLYRTDYGPEHYLSFLQLQNRNHLDFSFQFPETSQLYREEANLKQFIVNNYSQSNLNPLKFRSDQDFYLFTSKYKNK